ncbi:BREX system serine/threonine kinase PglW [Frankia sp. Mgl5]|uniref:BREX system serine/threonine kinase PglW n=1 Tax=Frankia sp. Mgl5 TaxID=2933793 RepID=UPI00200FA55F|nr:BREX system serine/threonine kinase PglW [Frankia sp. Mgl5]MCK9928238.1 BREX system serine/threonine kinase PglW [Frankia sp. Mgl5]
MQDRRWTTVTASQFPHEREALEHVQRLLPDAEPYRAWSNFTFVASTGHLREVDLLVVARGGVYLIEIKSWAGRLTASGSNWVQHRPSGGDLIFDNPLILANQKSKELKHLLETAARAQGLGRLRMPFFQPAVFLSNGTLKVELPDFQLHGIFGPEPATGGAPIRAGTAGALPSIWSGLLDAPLRDERHRISPETSRRLATLLPAAGIARSRRHQRVGAWELEFPAFESGPTWQDYHARHTQMSSARRRVRIYLVETGAAEAERRTREAAAKREFLVLNGIDHQGIVQIDGLEQHEAGPALIFRHHPDEMRLDHYLARYGDRLDAGTRLRMIRELAETLDYAHGRHLYHRTLAARSVLVVPAARRGDDQAESERRWLSPRLVISDWQAAARDLDASTGQLTGSMTTTSVALAIEPAHRFLPQLERAAESYLAPEVDAPYPDPVGIDVFGLGALAYLILTGEAPAPTRNALKARLAEAGGLHPSAVVDSLSETANDLVALATRAKPEDRFATVGEFLDWLQLVVDDVIGPAGAAPESAAPESATTPTIDLPAEPAPELDPLEAERGDLVGGEWRIRSRLGTGSTSRAFLARNEKTNRDEVLKVALSDERAPRLAHEADVLGRLRDSRVIRLARQDTLVIGGRTVLVLDHAGEQTMARKLREGRLSVDDLDTFAGDLFVAVDYLDGEGVAHRDLKPDNIVLRRRPNRTWQLVLIDFSLANHSVRDTAAGTPRYLDPFLGAGTRTTYDDQAERYALAVTLHEMASGELPLWGDGSTEARFTEGPPTVATEAFDPAIRAGLTSFFLRALDRDAGRRFGSLKDMRDAWLAVFRAADSTPPVPSVHPPAGEQPLTPDEAAAAATEVTPLEQAGLSPRAVSAAHRLDSTTVGDLLDLGSKDIIGLPGLAGKTRQELQSRIRQWRRALAPAPQSPPAGGPPGASPGASPTAQPATATDYARMPVELVADRLLPRSARATTEADATRLLLGLPDDAGTVPDLPLWPGQQLVAERVGVTPGRIAQVLTARRKAWHADAAVRSVHGELVEILAEAGRVMGFDELVTAMLARRGSSPGTIAPRARAAAVVRAALETVDLDSEPRIARRKYKDSDRVLVALEVTEADGPATPSAPALLDYAVALGKVADRLAKAEELPSPATVLRELAAASPDGMPALAAPRLVGLAAAASRTAATNARLEIYPRALGLVRALRLSQAGVLLPPRPGGIPAQPTGSDERTERDPLLVETIHERVLARFPGLATELPPHPRLDGPLRDAGFTLDWDHARGGYRQPHGLLSSTGLGSWPTPVVRQPTGLGAWAGRSALADDSPSRVAAATAEQRLTAAAETGGFRALTVRRSHYLTARAELAKPHRFAAEPVDVAAVFLDALHAEVDPKPRPTWATILRADTAEPGSRAAANLAEYVRLAWERAAPLLTALLDAPAGRVGPGGQPAPLLLHDAGVFGRYDGRGLDVLFTLAERARTRAGGRPLWLLCPTTEPSLPPRLDGALVQLVTGSDWVPLPDSWVANLHRATGDEPGLAAS